MSVNPIEIITDGEPGAEANHLAVTAMAAYILEAQGVEPPRSHGDQRSFDVALRRQRAFNAVMTRYDDTTSIALLIAEATKMARKVVSVSESRDAIFILPPRFHELEGDVLETVAPLFIQTEPAEV